MESDDEAIWPTAEQRAYTKKQVDRLRGSATKGGLRFEAYLPPSLASWLLDEIKRGTFVDPSEAVFVMAWESKDMQPHMDLRRELLRRRVQSSLDDPRPSIPADEAFAKIKAKFAGPLPEPAVWTPFPKPDGA